MAGRWLPSYRVELERVLRVIRWIQCDRPAFDGTLISQLPDEIRRLLASVCGDFLRLTPPPPLSTMRPYGEDGATILMVSGEAAFYVLKMHKSRFAARWSYGRDVLYLHSRRGNALICDCCFATIAGSAAISVYNNNNQNIAIRHMYRFHCSGCHKAGCSLCCARECRRPPLLERRIAQRKRKRSV